MFEDVTVNLNLDIARGTAAMAIFLLVADIVSQAGINVGGDLVS